MAYRARFMIFFLMFICGISHAQTLIGNHSGVVPGKGLFVFYQAQDYVALAGGTGSYIIPMGSTANIPLFIASTPDTVTTPTVTASGAITMAAKSVLKSTPLGGSYGIVQNLRWNGTSFAVSIQPKSWSATNYIINFFENTTMITGILMTSDRKVFFAVRRLSEDSYTLLYSPTAYTALDKLGIVGTEDFATGVLTMYVNGVSIASGTVTTGITSGLYRNISIGDVNGTYGMQCYCRAWMMYERCLTSQEAIRLSLYLRDLL